MYIGEGMSYPDSVRRVKPPNTTIPKTLAALPNSQYATTFWLVLGKPLFFAFVAFLLIDLPRDERDDDG